MLKTIHYKWPLSERNTQKPSTEKSKSTTTYQGDERNLKESSQELLRNIPSAQTEGRSEIVSTDMDILYGKEVTQNKECFEVDTDDENALLATDLQDEEAKAGGTDSAMDFENNEGNPIEVSEEDDNVKTLGDGIIPHEDNSENQQQAPLKSPQQQWQDTQEPVHEKPEAGVQNPNPKSPVKSPKAKPNVEVTTGEGDVESPNAKIERRKHNSSSSSGSCSGSCSSSGSGSSGTSGGGHKTDGSGYESAEDGSQSDDDNNDMLEDDDAEQQVVQPDSPIWKQSSLQSPKSRQVRVKDYMASIGCSGVQVTITKSPAKKTEANNEKKAAENQDVTHMEDIVDTKKKGSKSKDKGKDKSNRSKVNPQESKEKESTSYGDPDDLDETNKPPDGFEPIADKEFMKIFNGNYLLGIIAENKFNGCDNI